MNVFERRCELMPRAELEQLQLERVQALLVRLKRNVRHYRDLIGDTRVESLADLAKLPMTTPEDMADSFPYGMFSLPLREVIRLHSAMGHQGRPLVIGHTRNDLAQWGRLAARQLVSSGVTANDVIQVCLGAGFYRGALGYVLGAEQIEASVIAEEPFHIDSQIAMLQNYRPTTLITTPVNARELVRAMEEQRIAPQSFQLRTMLLSRPVDAREREALGAGLMVRVLCNFGIEEVVDPGLCVECCEGRFHVNEDHFLAEICDGELVVTTLCREALPLLRYRTRIACGMKVEECACGRTGAVITPGERLDGRLRVSETPFYEEQIAQVLEKTRARGHKFWTKVSGDTLIIYVQLTTELFSDMMWPLDELQREIAAEFLTRHGIPAQVRLVQSEPFG